MYFRKKIWSCRCSVPFGSWEVTRKTSVCTMTECPPSVVFERPRENTIETCTRPVEVSFTRLVIKIKASSNLKSWTTIGFTLASNTPEELGRRETRLPPISVLLNLEKTKSSASSTEVVVLGSNIMLLAVTLFWFFVTWMVSDGKV